MRAFSYSATLAFPPHLVFWLETPSCASLSAALQILIPLMSPVSATSERESSEALLEDAVKRQGFQGEGLEASRGGLRQSPWPVAGLRRAKMWEGRGAGCQGSVGGQRSKARRGGRGEEEVG